MFTGIILGQGSIHSLHGMGQDMRLCVHTLFDLPHIVIGESIAINGVCLTVERGQDNLFHAYASAETLRRTNLGSLRTGSRVNVERALAVGDRLGGHMVSGHVDCLATVQSVDSAGQSRIICLHFPENYAPEVIAKGSVALDGISLTVNECGPSHLVVNVIPETWSVTTVAAWSVGSKVNMETDIIGKYVRHMLAPVLTSGTASPFSATSASAASATPTSTVTEALLHEHGFIS